MNLYEWLTPIDTYLFNCYFYEAYAWFFDGMFCV